MLYLVKVLSLNIEGLTWDKKGMKLRGCLLHHNIQYLNIQTHCQYLGGIGVTHTCKGRIGHPPPNRPEDYASQHDHAPDQQRQSRERQETPPRRNNPNMSQINHLASRQPQSTPQGPPRHSGYYLQNTPARQNYYQGNYTDTLEKSVMAMNNSLVKILQEQQSAQLETTHALANLSRSHEDQAIDHIIKDIPKFNGN